jgi:hypothetical protein
MDTKELMTNWVRRDQGEVCEQFGIDEQTLEEWQANEVILPLDPSGWMSPQEYARIGIVAQIAQLGIDPDNELARTSGAIGCWTAVAMALDHASGSIVLYGEDRRELDLLHSVLKDAEKSKLILGPSHPGENGQRFLYSYLDHEGVMCFRFSGSITSIHSFRERELTPVLTVDLWDMAQRLPRPLVTASFEEPSTDHKREDLQARQGGLYPETLVPYQTIRH